MKNILFGGVVLAMFVLQAQAASDADKGWAVAQKAGCTRCHAIDRAKIGPAWQDLHLKYRNDAGAKARLLTKLKNAGSEHPEVPVKAKDIDELVPWVIAGPEKSMEIYNKGYRLAERAGCTKCHGVDAKKVGPVWRDVAAKYKADKGAEAALSQKLKNAGDDHPEIKIYDSDRKILVPWVLSL